MKIFISADMEGIAGPAHWDEVDKTHANYAEFREQMTAEVVAACEGALNAGATEIVIKDAHWTGRNIIAAKLPREARLIRGWTRDPYSMMAGLDSSFHAALMVGYHARSGSDGSPLAHTLTERVASVTINDRYAAEFLINAYTAGLFGVPVIFLSGDAAICADAADFLPGMATVATMEGIGNATNSIHPDLAIERIREGVETALKANVSRCNVVMPAHFVAEITYQKHITARQVSFYPGAHLSQSHRVQFEADDYFDILRFFMFGISMTND